jgi:hypothetical protein
MTRLDYRPGESDHSVFAISVTGQRDRDRDDDPCLGRVPEPSS